MSRRLRLALLLAALATAGPFAGAPPAFLAPRELVSVAWHDVVPASPQKRRSQPGTPVAVSERAEFRVPPRHVLPDRLRVHSLLQRPPPIPA